MERISSRQNPLVKRFRALAASSTEHLLLDGAHLLEDALAAGVPVEVVVVHEALGDRGVRGLADEAQRRGARIVEVTHGVLAAISPVRQPSGVVAIGARPAVPIEAAFEHPPQMVLLVVDVQDPGNVGAIVRAADACGATGIVTGEGTADPFGWKALRGSMGSVFRMPVAARQPIDSAIDAARIRGIQVYAAVPRGGTPLPRCDLRGATGVLLGGEGSGLSDRFVALCDGALTIPMRPRVESLNVATAAALVVYEALRQREEAAA